MAFEMSDEFVAEKIEDYKKIVTEQQQFVPRHSEICQNKMKEGYLLAFINTDVGMMMQLKMMQVIVVLDALQRYADFNKYTLADAAINGFDLDENYKRAVIADIMIIEELYEQFYENLVTIDNEFTSKIGALDENGKPLIFSDEEARKMAEEHGTD